MRRYKYLALLMWHEEHTADSVGIYSNTQLYEKD